MRASSKRTAGVLPPKKRGVRRAILRVMLAGLILAAAFIQIAVAGTFRDYVATVAADAPVTAPVRPVPDLRPFTQQAVRDMLTPARPGVVTIRKMYEIPGLLKFVRSGEFAFLSQRQGLKRPEAVYVQSGAYDLPELVRALNRPDILRAVPGGYLLQRPLYVGKNATLMIAGAGTGANDARPELKLSLQAGAFLVNGGRFIASHAAITGWDMAAGAVSRFKRDDAFRPFYTAWSGSETYLADTRVTGLGYHTAKAYGFSLSTDPGAGPSSLRPTGWIIGCRFADLYYGFYSYEAYDVVLLDNVYRDNIVYGIDPHDRSRRLVIARNDVSGTRQKHGIIGSRGVDDSWIFDNLSYGNHGSGIMLDRSSRHNLVARNVSKNNGAYGIALLESQDNLLRDNLVAGNHGGGIKIRNGWNVTADGNRILDNRGFGVLLTASSIASDPRRDFKEDPYTMRSSLQIKGGRIAGNGKGQIRFETADFLRLNGVGLTVAVADALSSDRPVRNRNDIAAWLANGRTVQIAPSRSHGGPDQ